LYSTASKIQIFGLFVVSKKHIAHRFKQGCEHFLGRKSIKWAKRQKLCGTFHLKLSETFESLKGAYYI